VLVTSLLAQSVTAVLKKEDEDRRKERKIQRKEIVERIKSR
jgi:hypothetical protein